MNSDQFGSRIKDRTNVYQTDIDPVDISVAVIARKRLISDLCESKRVLKKRPKLNTVGIQIQSENLEIEDVLPQLGENVNSEILEDKLEEILPFEQTSILKTMEAEPKKREKVRGWYLNKRYIADIKCGICDSTFENRIIYDAHMIQEHGVNPYDCLICPDATFPTHYQLRKHQKEFHGENMTKEVKTEWPCDIPGCKYVGKTRRNLYSHKRNHVITEKPWKCNQCDYSCKLKANLLIHQEMV